MKRMTLTLGKKMVFYIAQSAKHDGVSMSQKIHELLKKALEEEEDDTFCKIAVARDTPNAEYISHEEFWRLAL